MALSRIGSKCLIEVENQHLKLSIRGDADYSANKVSRHNTNMFANFALFPQSPQVHVKTIDASNNLTVNKTDTMLPCFFEELQYLVVLEKENTQSLLIRQNGIDITSDFFQQGDLFIGNLQFGSEVGYTPIEVLSDGRLLMRLILEVFPSKIDYHKDYLSMMDELNEEIASIVYQLFSKTFLYGSTRYVSRQTGSEYLSILDLVFNNLISSIDYVVHHFRYNIANNSQLSHSHRAKRASRETLRYVRSNPGTLVQSRSGSLSIAGNQYSPQKIIENKKSTTSDIFENRYVKYTIVSTIRSISRLEKLLQNSYRGAILKYDLKGKREKLNRYVGTYFQNVSDLSGDKSLSLVFQLAPGYKEVYKNYQLLRKGLNLGCDLYTISPKRIHELYEYWCYLKVHNILKEIGYSPIGDGFVKPKHNGLYLSLARNIESSVIYYNGENKLTLWYNKSYNGLPTNDQRPDIVLQLQSKNPSHNRMYIFDAKYRLDIVEGKEYPKSDDINIMHRYRDAIVSRTGKAIRYKYETFGAFVLFPCADEKAFLENKYYRSISEVNIGAFPMLPGSTSLLQKHLSNLIGQTSIEANSDRPVLDDYDDYAKFKLENVMVVNVKDAQHFDAYREHRFFHIPQRRLSNLRLGIEYLAFYQSKKSFGDSDAGITYYARIKSCRTYQRGDCAELPLTSGNSAELYLRFELEEIQTLPTIKAIQYGTQLVTFTTTYLLLNAENIHELKLTSSFEVKVYKILRGFSEAHKLRLVKRG